MSSQYMLLTQSNRSGLLWLLGPIKQVKIKVSYNLETVMEIIHVINVMRFTDISRAKTINFLILLLVLIDKTASYSYAQIQNKSI